MLAGESRAFGAAAKDAGWSDVEVQEWVDMPHVFQVFDAVASEGGGGDSVRGGVRGAGHGEMSPSRREMARWRRPSFAAGEASFVASVWRRTPPRRKRAAVDDEIRPSLTCSTCRPERCHPSASAPNRDAASSSPAQISGSDGVVSKAPRARARGTSAPRRARRRDSTAHAARRSRVFRRRRKEAEPQSRDGRARERPRRRRRSRGRRRRR